MTPEGKVVSAIKKRVKELGGQVRKCQWVGHRGAPDLFVMFAETHAWIEVKSETGRLAPEQAREIKRMREAGCVVDVVYGEEAALSVIDWISKRSKQDAEQY